MWLSGKAVLLTSRISSACFRIHRDASEPKEQKERGTGRKLEQVVCSQIIHGPHDKVNVELKRLQCWEQRMGWLHLPFFLWSTNHTDKTWNFVNKIFLRIFVLMVLSEIINSSFPQSVFFLMIKLNELWKH